MTMSTVGMLTLPRTWMRLLLTVTRVPLGVVLCGVVVYTDTGVGGVAAAIGRDLIALDEDSCIGAFADAWDALC